MVENEPLKPSEAKKLIRHIKHNGLILFSDPHARERLQKHKMSTVDCMNILRGGGVDNPEFENGEWRYQVHTGKMAVIVRFENENELMIVTAWRLK